MSAEYFIFSLTIYNKMARYTGNKGKIYEFGDNEKIAEGFEGIVYHIIGDLSNVAKIYKKDSFKTSDYAKRKLEAMLKFNIKPICNNKLRLAWPEDILYDNGEMVGFVMPSVTSKTTLHQICRNGKERLRLYPDYSWKHALQFSYLLAWAVDYVHANGIVIGDMNQNNIIIDTENDTVILTECDLFDITDPVTKEHFPCTVGMPEILAPEIQGSGKLNQAPFSKESDNFSLAIHIFRLLMMNADPFCAKLIGKNVDSVAAFDTNRSILNGESPFFRKLKNKVVPPWAPPLDLLPDDIINAFKRTLCYTQTTVVSSIKNRTTANEWKELLFGYVQPEPNPKLTTCPEHHVYSAHRAKCPFCEINGKNNSTLKF